MENKDKEAILNNIPLDEEGHREFFTKKEIYQVMESIASQNEELIKENERLGHIIDEVDFKLSMMEDYAHGEVGNEITRLRKTISELLGGKTINKITQLQSTIDERDKEIERLKGLIYYAWFNGSGCHCDSCCQNWQQFKTENHL